MAAGTQRPRTHGWVRTGTTTIRWMPVPSSSSVQQELRFARSADGTRIAWARHGSGPPLVIATCWLSHLQYDWESPVWRHFLHELGRFATVVRYDERGHGLSDRDVTDFTQERRVEDLEAVVAEAGYDRFALMVMAQGGPVGIEYTARHPGRVTRLVFYGSYAAAQRDATPEDLELSDTFEAMIKVGWARPESMFRRVFTSMMIPEATEEQMSWLDELQRRVCTAEVAYTSRVERNRADAIARLPEIDVPTLVIHSTGDRMNAFDEAVFLTERIRGARLVPLDSQNHIVLGDEPAWRVFVDEVRSFLGAAEDTVGDGPTTLPAGRHLADVLSERELEVLRLVADGLDNEAIAERLYLSVRTVERHLTNIYVKLDLTGRAARAAAVGRLLSAP